MWLPMITVKWSILENNYDINYVILYFLRLMFYTMVLNVDIMYSHVKDIFSATIRYIFKINPLHVIKPMRHWNSTKAWKTGAAYYMFFFKDLKKLQ